MNDTRLDSATLQAAVDFAYGGAAVREGRKAQAHALAAIFRVKSAGGKTTERQAKHKI